MEVVHDLSSDKKVNEYHISFFFHLYFFSSPSLVNSPISVFPRPRQLCLMLLFLLLLVEIIGHAGTRGLIMGNIDSSPDGLLGTQRGPGNPRKSRREKKNLQSGNLLHRPRVGSTNMYVVHTGGSVVQTSSLEFFIIEVN